MRFERLHLRLTCLLTTSISSHAIILTHICILMAFWLSPRKYFNGKFCFRRLNSVSICQRLRYTSHRMLAGVSKSLARKVIVPSSLLSFHLVMRRHLCFPDLLSFTNTTPLLGLRPRRWLSSSLVIGRFHRLRQDSSTISSLIMISLSSSGISRVSRTSYLHFFFSLVTYVCCGRRTPATPCSLHIPCRTSRTNLPAVSCKGLS